MSEQLVKAQIEGALGGSSLVAKTLPVNLMTAKLQVKTPHFLPL